MTDRPLHGRVAIVTGAASGLGRSYALALARAGAQVVVNDLAEAVEAANQTCELITSAGGRALLVAAAAGDGRSGESLVSAAVDAYGRLDIVVSNAGVLRSELFPGVTDEAWELHQRVHVDGAFHLARAAWPHLLASSAGRLVLTTSAAGLFGAQGLSAYGASKMSIVGLLRVLAVEAADSRVRVNAVAPLAWTPMSQAGGRTGSAAQIIGPDRFATFSPDSVAEVVVALSHPDCPAQGQIISVGGDRVAEIVIGESEGHFGHALDWRGVLGRWEVITDRQNLHVPSSMRDELELYGGHA